MYKVAFNSSVRESDLIIAQSGLRCFSSRVKEVELDLYKSVHQQGAPCDCTCFVQVSNYIIFRSVNIVRSLDELKLS